MARNQYIRVSYVRSADNHDADILNKAFCCLLIPSPRLLLEQLCPFLHVMDERDIIDTDPILVGVPL
jgi:hypothetical protein